MKKFISESFFNPILHILPIIIFLIVEDAYGISRAWIISFPVAFLLLVYVLLVYRSIFLWHVISMMVYVSIAGIVTVGGNILKPEEPYATVMAEVVSAFFLLVLFVFKPSISQLVVRLSSKKVSMYNNLNELIKTTNTYMLIFGLFVVSYVITHALTDVSRDAALSFVYQVYVVVIVLVILYEFIRVFAIRGHLLSEEWLPIVNENGNEIGSIQSHVSLSGERKYMHPVIRVIVIEGNRFFLKQHTCKDSIHPSKWDNAICTHMRLKENLSDSLARALITTYNTSDLQPPVFLSNYLIENEREFQYVHLFISCKLSDVDPNPDNTDRVKWWTIQQINEELESGIFSANFLKEFELLKRSGLIDTGRCTCDCKLRDELEDKR